jgi:hypothetical protein
LVLGLRQESYTLRERLRDLYREAPAQKVGSGATSI